MIQEIKKQRAIESIILHIVPGVLIALFMFSFGFVFRKYNLPALLFLQLSIFVVLLPWIIIIFRIYKNREFKKSIKDLIPYNEKSKWYEYLLFSIIMLVFAGVIMVIMSKTFQPLIKNNLFNWMPSWMDVTDINNNPQNYSPNMLIFVWFFGILTTGIIAPVLEEVYFRGFLLPRINSGIIGMILVEAVLFSLYHVFSLWMVPGRVIAIIPFIYLVIKKKNIKIAIFGHCLLNIVGDTLSMIPIVFK
jgi:hypothetical protein